MFLCDQVHTKIWYGYISWKSLFAYLGSNEADKKTIWHFQLL